MTFDVHISDLAESDIDSAYRWCRDNRSSDQANRWFHQIHEAVETLSKMPFRCPRCDDTKLSDAEIRQLLFGIGRRPTHRIVFEIDEDKVIILRVRQVAQKSLQIEDLE
jgi:plasmid stabilization system protein ParE